MSAERFYKVDLDFWHKRTCDRLLKDLGPWGPCVWLALIAEAKRSRIPGTLIVTSEIDFWQMLGLWGEEHRQPTFTMDEFLTLTGRLKHTSRTPVGRLIHVVLTAYGDWQQDWRREDDRHRQKSRRSRVSARDTDRDTPRDTGCDTSVTELEVLDLDTPLPPFSRSDRKHNSAAEAWIRNVGWTLTDEAPNDLDHELRERRGLDDLTVRRLTELARTIATQKGAA